VLLVMPQNLLASMLRPLDIVPGKIGPKKKRLNGYTREHFNDAFERYLEPEGASEPDTRTPCDEMGTSDTFKVDTSTSGCPVEKCEKSNNDGLVSGCPDEKGESGKGVDTAPPNASDEPPPLMPSLQPN
jgi:hypothetical protein